MAKLSVVGYLFIVKDNSLQESRVAPSTFL